MRRFLITAITRFLDVWTGTKGTLRGSCGPKSLFGNLLQEEALASQGSGRGQPGARHTEQSFTFLNPHFYQNNADEINVRRSRQVEGEGWLGTVLDSSNKPIFVFTKSFFTKKNS